MKKSTIASAIIGITAVTILSVGVTSCGISLEASAATTIATLTTGDETYFSYGDFESTATASIESIKNAAVYQYSDTITPPTGNTTAEATGLKFVASSSNSYVYLTVAYNYGCARWTLYDTTGDDGDNVTCWGMSAGESTTTVYSTATYAIDDDTTAVVIRNTNYHDAGLYSLLDEDYAYYLMIYFHSAGTYYLYDTANRWTIDIPNQDATKTLEATLSGGVSSYESTTTKTETTSGLAATEAIKLYRTNDSGYRYYLYAENYGAAYSLNYYDNSSDTEDEELLTEIDQLLNTLDSNSYYILFTTASSYSLGYSNGYTDGYSEGKEYGYTLGYAEGYDTGATEDLNFLDWIISCVNQFLDVEFFGTFSIGDLLMAAIAITVCVILLKMFAGG